MKRSAAPLTISFSTEGEWQRISFTGPFNEDMKPALLELASKLTARCVFDFGAVTLVNSVGIRDWVHFMRQVGPGREIELDRCTDDLVQTINLVASFASGFKIRSCLRSYVCSDESHEETIQLIEGVDYAMGQGPLRTKTVQCRKCAATCDPVEPDETFYLFSTYSKHNIAG